MRRIRWTSLYALGQRALSAPNTPGGGPSVAPPSSASAAGAYLTSESTMTVKATAPIYIAAAIQERAADAPAAEPGKPRTLHVVASTEALDSHESVLVQNWDLKRFAENPVVLWAHSRAEIPIGRAKAKLVGAKGEPGRHLEADITFPPAGKFKRSDEVWDAWEEGLLRGVSVGFKAHTIRWEKIKDRDVLVFDDLELLELSFVPVGSNPETLADVRALAIAERYGPTRQGKQGTEVTLRLRDEVSETAASAAAAVRDLRSAIGVEMASEASLDQGANAPSPAHASTAAPAAPVTEKRMDPKILARDLGLPEDATETQIRSAVATTRAAATGLATVLGALGVETVDAARGAIEAGKTAAAELVKSQARTKELEDAAEATERAVIVAKLETEKRLTPAQRDGFAKTVSIETLREFAKTAPVIVGESQHREAPAGAPAAGASASTVTHGGKAYEQITGPERIELRSADPDTFNALRNDWIRRGQPQAKAAG